MSDGVYYRTEVTGVGPEVPVMAEDGVLILFGEPVPAELAEVAVLHAPEGEPARGIEVGDVLEGAGAPLVVTGVGSRADENLRSLGHVVLYCDPGPDVALLPGALHVSGRMGIPETGQPIRLRSAGDA